MNIVVGQPGGHQGNQVARQQRYNQMRGQQQMNRGSMQQGANTRGAMQGNRGGMNQGRGLFLFCIKNHKTNILLVSENSFLMF